MNALKSDSPAPDVVVDAFTPIRLSNGSTGCCPCGCDRDAYPYAIPGHPDGHVDAAHECARAMVVDYLESLS